MKPIKSLLTNLLAKREKSIVKTVRNLGRDHHVDVFNNEYTNDFVRLSLLDLAVDELGTHSVEGSIAELGVYKGHFASVLNEAFPDKDIFLFDTFEGFNEGEEAHDKEVLGLEYDRDFTDTSVSSVIDRMPNPDRCIVRKGLFPDTAAGLEDEIFCFVSIDTDLYLPILNGLEFFFERLSKGGFIFVHDYNNSLFPGARQAVLEFSSRHSISFVPVCDAHGSAVFRK